ncbi:DNA polymerase III subunit alpha [Pseudomonas putida]|uniref:DNA polymerase III subunit alpha n=1 Tax=Pseudomonas putida TaxID=303 RepID=A0A8I1ECD8_PSEPU|nr:DNA polymerase III subunit alpha [Pseudomonas putida]
MSFVHLSVHTEFSLHDSLVRVKPLMKAAAASEMPAIAITDDSNLFCAIKSYNAAMSNGVKPIIGAQLLVQTSRIATPSLITILCKDNQGYRYLTDIISKGYDEGERDKEKRPIIPLDWFEGRSAGLIALSGGREGEVGRLLLNKRNELAFDALNEYKELFGDNFYLELQRIGHPADDRYVREAVEIAIETETPVVATNAVRFMAPEDFTSHEIRLAIAQGRKVQSLREDMTAPCTKHQYLKSPEEMRELFSDIPEALENTVLIAAQCSVDITLGKSFLPEFPVPQGMNESDFLRESSERGLEERFRYYFKTDEAIAAHREEYVARLNFELKTINDMGFPGYFLIVADFIRWAKENDIPVGPGRGSGAGSLVAYALGITDINPIPYHLLFERFLNPERVSMPDFDVDFCMDKRDLVIQYVAEKYGQKAVSQIITFGTMAAKMVIKDVARAMGHPYRFGDSLSKMIPERPGVTIEEALAEVSELRQEYETNEEVKVVIDHALALEGVTRQTGKHAGGVVIAKNKELTEYTPTYRADVGDSLVCQYDKDDAEAAGLVKFDFLGLRNLTIIDHAIKTINARRGKEGLPPIDILAIDLEDRPSYELLKRCETTAVFQLESNGMKNLIKRLQPDRFEDIIALVALFRPGPLQSGMVDDFVDRKHGRAEVTYPHPLLEGVLEPTYGVIVYQEQVMQIAQVLAGYTLGGADMLRRAMGKKKPEEMAKQRAIFVDGCLKHNNIEGGLAGSIFDLMEKFAEYGFNKSHSAAYALIAYQTAFLKAHYPADFMSAVLSSDMDNTDKVVRFIHECRSMNLDIIPPHANHSTWLFAPHDGKIVYGMGAIKGLGEKVAEGILRDREYAGEYQNLTDFLFRNSMPKRVAEACIHAGMFDYTEMDRSELLAVCPLALLAGKQLQKQAGQGMLFEMEIPPLPRVDVPVMETDIRLSGERKVLGLYLTGHPYEKYRSSLMSALTGQLIDIVKNAEDDTIDRADKYYNITIAGLMTGIDIKNTNAKGNYAFFKLDDGSARLDCKIFPKGYHEYQAFIKDDNLVVIHGQVRMDTRTETVSVIVDTVQPLESFLQNQTGRVIINLPEGARPFREMAKIHGLSSLQDEGSLRIYMKTTDQEELVEIPQPPISSNGPAIQKLRDLWGAGIVIEYVKQQGKVASRKVSIDIDPVAETEDLEAVRADLRLQLETFLDKGYKAMYGSSESGMSPD